LAPARTTPPPEPGARVPGRRSAAPKRPAAPKNPAASEHSAAPKRLAVSKQAAEASRAARPAARLIEVPNPVAGGAVNAWLLPGAVPTLVDPGPATPAAMAALEQGLATAGLRPVDIARVVVTRGRAEHEGLAGWLHTRGGGGLTHALGGAGAVVLAHPLGHGTLVDPAAAGEARADLFARAGRAGAVPPDLLDAALAAMRDLASRAAPVPEAGVRAVVEGARVRAGDAVWTVLHTPGPAPDHVCLYHAPSGTLVGGDLLARGGPPHLALEPRRDDGARPRTLDDLARSWRRVGHLPIGIVWPASGPPVRAHRVLVARRLADVRLRLAAVRRALVAGAGTIWEVTGALGPPVTAESLPGRLAEAVALIDWLAARGRVERAVRGGVVRVRWGED